MSPARHVCVNRLAAQCAILSTNRSPLVCGINGIDASGKTLFAMGLAAELKKLKRAVTVVNVDDFHNPKSVRYANTNLAHAYYYDSFSYAELIDKVLTPFRTYGHVDVTLMLLDLESDTFTAKRTYVASPGTVLLLEGVFLFRPELIGLIDFRIYLEVSETTALARAKVRDKHIQQGLIESRYQEKYFAGQQLYCCESAPFGVAHVVIDNNNYDEPRVLKWTEPS
jgi:uridine kinase